MNIYLISGLGADHRVFQYLTIDKEHTLIHLNWLKPERAEAMEQYAERLAGNIDRSQPFALIGVSFGGMIATEIAKILTPFKTILISSICRYKELPVLYRIAGKIRLHKLIPSGVSKKGNALIYWLSGVKNAPQRELLSQILMDSNITFTRWAIDTILRWKNNEVPDSVIRIHGTKDRLLPIHIIPDHVIKDGGHLIVVNMADHISLILNDLLKE